MSLVGNATATDNLHVLRGKIKNLSPYAIDASLTIEGSAADAKAVGLAFEKKVNYTDIVDNLTTSDSNKPLSANQGNEIRKAITKMQVDTDESFMDVNKSISNVQDLANGAKNLANNAQTAADNAQTAADNAQTAADNAQTAADNAQTAADNRVSKLNNIATLTVSGWSNNAQTVSVIGVTENNTIIVGSDPENYTAYAESGVRCTGQGDGTLTFECEIVPDSDLKANVLILNQGVSTS